MNKESSIKLMTFDNLSQLLKLNYEKYAEKHSISIDENFLFQKIAEEFGELSSSIIAARKMHPKKQASISEEACDLLCQIIVFIEFQKLNIYTTMSNKWLQDVAELDSNEG